MQSKLFTLLTLLLAFCYTAAWSQKESPYQPALFISEAGDTLPYRILYPQNFDPDQQYPLLIFLHGAGERGRDNTAQLTHGSELFLKEEHRKDMPAIVVFPQCPPESFWSNVAVKRDSQPLEFDFQTDGEPTEAMQLLLSLVDELTNKPYVEQKQIYVGGLSMGGMGTLELLRRRPKRFAAAFAICGGDNPENAKKYKGVPLWLFHGAKDDVVPASLSVTLAEQLEELGARNIRFTLYPEADHNSWDKALAEPQFLPWLFSKCKK
ncbi:MAG: prolyl oligopeptidase family serine peptidase [Bacteroidetes bacterium]|nr:prolyl oligopeptidase family serine peptidase [Bacteroidota bacterium]